MGAGAQREEADRRVAREAEVAAARAADKAARAAAAAEYQEPDWVQVHVSPPGPSPPPMCQTGEVSAAGIAARFQAAGLIQV